MPFGKYRGHRLADVPPSYLRWVLRACDIDGWLEAATRDTPGAGRATGRPGPSPPPRAMAVQPADIDGWYGRLALRRHPDRGGTVEAMQAIADARDTLIEL